MAELHQTYAPTTTAGAVITTNPGSSTNVGQQVPQSQINSPDDVAGSNAPTAPGGNSGRLVISGGTISGRFDQFSVIKNPA